MNVLKRDMPVRKENVVLYNDNNMMTVQVIGLNNPNHVTGYDRITINAQ